MAEELVKNYDVLRQLFTDCLAAKKDPKNSENSENSDIAVDETVRKATLSFVLLKKANRKVQNRLQQAKEKLDAKKCVIDNKRSHLQNLLYEADYLKREIRLCYQFNGPDEYIDDICGGQRKLNEDDCTNALTHKQRLERLECELNVRKQLAIEYNKLAAAKIKVCQDIANLKKSSKFKPSLRILLEAAKPLQDNLQLPLEQTCKFGSKIQLLPCSLYLAYVNLKFIQMNMEHFKVTAGGSEADVKTYNKIRNQMDVKDLSKEQLLQPHPLYLQIMINIPEFESSTLIIDIFNIPLLNFVTARCNIHLMDNIGAFSESTIMQDFLKYICEGDLGDCMPYVEIEGKLQKFNLHEAECLNYLSQNNWGKPYRWLQQICGGAPTTLNGKCDKLKAFATDIIKRLKEYWQVRLRLLDQIKSFMKLNLDIYMDKNERKCKPQCSLVQWSPVTWEEYASNPITLRYREEGLIDKDCNIFRAIFISNSARMDCLISTSNKYLYNAPLWVITVHCNGQYYNSLNNADIKIMEYSTNCQRDIKCNLPHLLADQLLRTMYSFDKYLETAGQLFQTLECNNEETYAITTYSKRVMAKDQISLF